ncbi:MAG: YjjG family noncanonical pyrimidine nucleotidase [Paludibacteraceae bacterium]|nr:YjjG family noncanonical pyrimidine nucleotidase [Paludibacteraceae bacterium]
MPHSSLLIPHSSFPMYNHILLDLDDTLWDFKANSRIAMQEIYNDYKLINHYDSFESFYSIYMEKNHQLWEQYAKGEITKDYLSLERFLHPLRLVGINDATLARQLGDDFLHRTTMQTQLVDGAIELLDYLKDKYTLSIISNGFVEVQYIKLRRSGLLPYFTHIFLSEEVGYQKPDIRFFQAVLEKLDAKNTECLVIGDNFQTDILGAQNAKIDAVFYKKDTEQTYNPSVYATEVNNLIAIKNIL